jgi:hypothetical protein
MLTNIKEFIKEQVEVYSLLQKAIDKIEPYLKIHDSVKIGKTADIENRFDTYYKDMGFIELIPIVKCSNKRVMDDLEKDLIKYFGQRIVNTQIGGGNKHYTNDYWIYIVVK